MQWAPLDTTAQSVVNHKEQRGAGKRHEPATSKAAPSSAGILEPHSSSCPCMGYAGATANLSNIENYFQNHTSIKR
jgi:hypothetical protein